MSTSGNDSGPTCPACGAAAAPGASTCSRCNAPLLTGTAAAPEPAPRRDPAAPQPGDASAPQPPPTRANPVTAPDQTPPIPAEPKTAAGPAGSYPGEHPPGGDAAARSTAGQYPAAPYPPGQYPPAPYPPGQYPPGPYPPYPPYVSGKRIPAGVLGILLGSWGVHRFYLNDILGGVLRILITIFTCGIGGVIGLIEGIIYLTKSDPEFDQIYLVERREWF